MLQTSEAGFCSLVRLVGAASRPPRRTTATKENRSHPQPSLPMHRFMEKWPQLLFTPQAADYGCGVPTKLSVVRGQRVPRLLASTAAARGHHTSSRPGPCWIRTEIALRLAERRTDGKVWGFATLQMSAKFPAGETFVHPQRC